MALADVACLILKVVKLIINIVVLLMYRFGKGGDFLGVGGTWNLNEEKNQDPEIITSGVFVGYLIYTVISMSDFVRATDENKQNFTDICMNVIGVFLWFAAGSTALHYWNQYYDETFKVSLPAEKQFGLAVGSLAIINGIVYLADAAISIKEFVQKKAMR